MSSIIEFYFDFYSPYGYLASLRIDEMAARHGRGVVWRPFLLGPAFAATGHQPLLDTPLMGDYAAHDFARSARLHGAQFRLPEEFPKAALAPSRAYYWLFDQDPDKAKQLAKAIYRSTFEQGRDGTQPELVAELAEPLGIDKEELLAAITTPEVKERLKQETRAALERGVFGSPFIFVEDEPFWGNDRLEQVDRWLQTGGW
ncbi:MAG: 2-hydroxychromene-2-carboxylate isomerase [Gammaproteobacteria bacterium]|nr:2-hydroxychromene-2-carboxylate isomerase [Gammaproteobacteria bacterium]